MRGRRKRLKPVIGPGATSTLVYSKTNNDAFAADRRLFLLCAAFYLVGVVTGAALFGSSSELLQNYFGYLIGGSVTARTAEKLLFTVIYTLIPRAALLLFCFVFCYCTAGAPLILLLICGSGAGTGLTGAYVCDRLGFLGILFNLIVIAPACALFVTGVINLAVKGIRASVSLYYIVYKGRTKRLTALNDEIYHALALGGAAAFVSSVLEGALFKLLGASLI